MAASKWSLSFDDTPPAAYACRLRRELRLGGYPVDAWEVCKQLGIIVKEDDLPAAVDGCLLREPGRKPGILINKNIPYPGRKRFTVAHEIGHFTLPSHGEASYWCLADDIEGYRAARTAEREANEFASELLLPEEEVRDFVEHHPASLAAARELADRCGTSLTAAALKMVSLAWQPCALVVSRSARVAWATASRHLRRSYAVRSAGPVAEESCASDLFRGRRVEPGPQKVGPHLWLVGGRKDYRELPYVEEESIILPRLDMVLSLIVVPEAGEDSEDIDEYWDGR